MTEIELLQFAAKAAGYTACFDIVENINGADFYAVSDPADFDVDACWNPLTDDGDALRLAVKLRIAIDHDGDATTPRDENGEQRTFLGPANPPEIDLAATRRAIVRAAAEIGRNMK